MLSDGLWTWSHVNDRHVGILVILSVKINTVYDKLKDFGLLQIRMNYHTTRYV